MTLHSLATGPGVFLGQKRAGTLPGNRVSAGPNADRGYGRSQGNVRQALRVLFDPARASGPRHGFPGYTRYTDPLNRMASRKGPGIAESDLWRIHSSPTSTRLILPEDIVLDKAGDIRLRRAQRSMFADLAGAKFRRARHSDDARNRVNALPGQALAVS